MYCIGNLILRRRMKTTNRWRAWYQSRHAIRLQTFGEVFLLVWWRITRLHRLHPLCRGRHVKGYSTRHRGYAWVRGDFIQSKVNTPYLSPTIMFRLVVTLQRRRISFRPYHSTAALNMVLSVHNISVCF